MLVANEKDFQAPVPRMGKSKNPQNSDAPFDHAPYFNFNDDKLKFDTNRSDNANDSYGSASGFLVPKSPSDSSGKGAQVSALRYLLPCERTHPPSMRPISSIWA